MRSRHAYVLQTPDGVTVEHVDGLLRRFDPRLRRRWGGRFLLAGGVAARWRRGSVSVAGSARVARGLAWHLGGRWQVAPPEPGEGDEQIEDMLRIYVPGKLVPAELLADRQGAGGRGGCARGSVRVPGHAGRGSARSPVSQGLSAARVSAGRSSARKCPQSRIIVPLTSVAYSRQISTGSTPCRKLRSPHRR